MKTIIARTIIIMAVIGLIGVLIYVVFILPPKNFFEETGTPVTFKTVTQVVGAYLILGAIVYTLYRIWKWVIDNA